MPLLKKVKSTSNRGLIGITEDGEEVALSEPFLGYKTKTLSPNFLKKFVEQEARKDEKRFYQIGPSEQKGDWSFVVYNVFSEREEKLQNL